VSFSCFFDLKKNQSYNFWTALYTLVVWVKIASCSPQGPEFFEIHS
jgi:hypothetical protein